MENEDRKGKMDFKCIAIQLVQNPEQVKEIIEQLETKMDLNPLIKELIYMRSDPRDYFGNDIDYEKCNSEISSVIPVILSYMDKDNFHYRQNCKKNGQKYDEEYDLDDLDLANILAYNPEQLDKIFETISNELTIQDFESLMESLEDWMQNMIYYPAEWFWYETNTSMISKNAGETLQRLYELEREYKAKRKQEVNKTNLEEGRTSELLENQNTIIADGEETQNNLPINELQFAKIYGKARGRIKEVFTKIKSFFKGNPPKKNNEDRRNR